MENNENGFKNPKLKPEDYILTGTLNEKLARIGLMVAPICMKYVAESVYQNILEPWNEVHNRTN